MEKRYRIDIPLPKEVQLALDVLDVKGYRAFIVGGAVRDTLLKRPVHDFDIATPSTPNQTMSCFPGFNISKAGKKHGTVTVIIHDHPVDITTFRIEGEYRDHRHPDSVSFTTQVEQDSSRRDFTINGLYYRSGEVFDFHDGVDDMKTHLIRAINDPDARFDEDALRILRGLRFACELDFSIEEKTREAMARKAKLLFDISSERIEAEIIRMASYPTFYTCIKENREVFLAVFDMLPESFIERLPKRADTDPYANIAGIFATADTAPELAYEALMKLRFSRSGAQAIQKLLSIDSSFTIQSVQDNLVFRRLLLDSDPLNPEVVIRYLILRDEIYQRNISNAEEVLAKAQNAELMLAIPSSLSELKVTGHDLTRLGCKPGPLFKQILEELLFNVNQLRVPNERKAQLEWLKKKIK